MDYFKIIPLEITLDVLARLPVDSVLNSKLVCSNWRNLVSHHPYFSKKHLQYLNHSSGSAADSGELGILALTYTKRIFWYIEYNENHDEPIKRIRRINFTPPFKQFYFLGSCNGLICLLDLYYPSVWICNPLTRENVMLPKINTYSIGFGYVSETNQYKVVGIAVSKTHVEVYVYTLGSGNGWRKLGNFNFESNYEWAQGVFSNEALYWLDDKLEMIIPFDLAEERFREHISPPPLPPNSDWCDARIGVLDGCLSFDIYLWVEGDRVHDIWLLKNKNLDQDMKEGEEHRSLVWSKMFRIDISKLFAVTKSDRVLAYGFDFISIYDPKTSTSKRLVKFKDWLLEVSLHKSTLVSLKELGEEDTKIMEPVEIEETGSRDYSFEQLQEDSEP